MTEALIRLRVEDCVKALRARDIDGLRNCLKRVAVSTKDSVHLGYEDTNIPYRSG